MALCKGLRAPFKADFLASLLEEPSKAITKIYTPCCTERRSFSKSNALEKFSGEGTPNTHTSGPPIDKVLKDVYDNPRLLLKAAGMYKEECKKFAKEVRDKFEMKQKILNKGDIDMLFTFEKDDSVKNFILTTDSRNKQGFSTASFVRTQYDTGLFSGYLDTRLPRDGKTEMAGYATINSKTLFKSFKRTTAYDWSDYNHIVMKIRGDGRSYLLILSCPQYLDITWQDQYHYPIYTRGGPYWQLVKIPFCNFYFTSGARVQDSQSPIELDKCSRVGITIADGNDGPFKLEIDYIGLEYQPLHKAICPYEEYNTELPLLF